MKIFSLLPILACLIGCTSHPTGKVTLRPVPPTVGSAARYGEVIRPYHVGRYVDPNHPEVMHETHPIYRVEASQRWNFHPGSTSSALLNPPQDASYTPAPTHDIVLAELSRQKDATQRVMWEASQLANMYEAMKKTVSDLSEVAKNHVWMQTRLANTEKQLKELSASLEKISRTLDPPPSTQIPSRNPLPLPGARP